MHASGSHPSQGPGYASLNYLAVIKRGGLRKAVDPFSRHSLSKKTIGFILWGPCSCEAPVDVD